MDVDGTGGTACLAVFDVSDPTCARTAGDNGARRSLHRLGRGWSRRATCVYMTRTFNDASDPDDVDQTFVDVVDVSNPAQPAVVATCALPGGTGHSGTRKIAAKGGYLYVPTGVVWGADQLCVVDVRDPLATKLVSTLGYGCAQPCVDGDLLLAGDQGDTISSGGLNVFDISGPIVPSVSRLAAVPSLLLPGDRLSRQQPGAVGAVADQALHFRRVHVGVGRTRRPRHRRLRRDAAAGPAIPPPRRVAAHRTGRLALRRGPGRRARRHVVRREQAHRRLPGMDPDLPRRA